MHRVGLVIESQSILDGLLALNIWGKHANGSHAKVSPEDEHFEISFIGDNLLDMRRQLAKTPFALLIVETRLAQMDGYRLLREIIQGGSCRFVALCSSEGDFPSARKGIQLGVAEYFTLPLSEAEIGSFLERIHLRCMSLQCTAEEHLSNLRHRIDRRDATSVHQYLSALSEQSVFPSVIDRMVADMFRGHEWLDLYLVEDDFLSASHPKALRQLEFFEDFLKKYYALYPPHGTPLKPIIQHILYCPEDDLRQKSIADELHISTSYLSMVFAAQTGLRYVDYISYVKLMRSAWLLRNSTMKVNEIAARMYYKDAIYFSRQFKKLFHITPSEYRIPDEYKFDI